MAVFLFLESVKSDDDPVSRFCSRDDKDDDEEDRWVFISTFFPMQNEGLLPARLKEGSVVHGFAGAAATHAQVRGETNDEQVSRHDRQSGRKQVRRGRRRVSNVKQKGSWRDRREGELSHEHFQKVGGKFDSNFALFTHIGQLCLSLYIDSNWKM